MSLQRVIDLLQQLILNRSELFESGAEKGMISGFSVDSRTLKSNEIYIALKGERVDGHLFLEEAKKRGALAAIISNDYPGPTFGLTVIRVSDPLESLQELAKKLLTLRKTRVVGVTGSVGKTTTKDFLSTFLKTGYRVASSPGNNNSKVGLPLAILNHTDGTEEILILEMGMTHSGDLKQLIQIAPPEVAVITSVALVHALNFESIDEIACAKGEILGHPNTKFGVISHDIANKAVVEQIGSCPKRTFSLTSPSADYYLNRDLDNLIKDSIHSVSIELGEIPLPGKHNLHNILAAATVARYFNIEWSQIIEACRQLALPEKRLQHVKKNDILFINDSYNACELSMIGALESMPTPTHNGSKIAVLGGMRELGKFSDVCHRRVGISALNHVDRVYCLGEESMPIFEEWVKADRPVKLFLDRADLVETLRNSLNPFDVVLLKGANSKQLWKVLDEL